MGEISEVCGSAFIREGNIMNYELIGIAATIFVLISFLMKETKRIRQVNIVGAFLFVIYGLLINSLSVWLLNGVLMLVHIRFLAKEVVCEKPTIKKLRRKKNERENQNPT